MAEARTDAVSIREALPADGPALVDVIMAINHQPVNSVDDVKRIQGTMKPGDAVAFRVMRRGRTERGEVQWQPLFVAGTLSANP